MLCRYSLFHFYAVLVRRKALARQGLWVVVVWNRIIENPLPCKVPVIYIITEIGVGFRSAMQILTHCSRLIYRIIHISLPCKAFFFYWSPYAKALSLPCRPFKISIYFLILCGARFLSAMLLLTHCSTIFLLDVVRKKIIENPLQCKLLFLF